MRWCRTAVACVSLLGAGVACTRGPAGHGDEGAGARELKVPRPFMVRRVPSPGTGCIADILGELEIDAMRPAACPEKEDGGPSCARACEGGDAVACYLRGGALEDAHAPGEQSTELYRRSCAFGLAIGCTNYGADLWGADDPVGWKCARRVLEKACAADEPWGCGMYGRMVIDADGAGAIERGRGRAILERACNEVGSFSCRALALELESGRLGPYKRPRIRKLLARACETGDEKSCGAPKSAAATFR
ncbi:MAG TPA: hypothetical protein VKQ32_12270 [Polyangia bacterium]|nr:hypothetical protein [Polyangia bacterium]